MPAWTPAHAQSAYDYEHLEFMIDPTYGGKPNPLADLKVRMALSLALDRVALVATITKSTRDVARQRTAWTPWAHLPGYTEPFVDTTIKGVWNPVRHAMVPPGKPRAIAVARALLAQTDFASGFTLNFVTTANDPVRLAEETALQAAWKPLRVTLNPTFGIPQKIFGDWDRGGVLVHGEFQVALFALRLPPDPMNFKFNLGSTYIDRLAGNKSATTNGNYSGIQDRVIDAGFAAAATATTDGARLAAFTRIQRRLVTRGYWLGLYFHPHT